MAYKNNSVYRSTPLTRRQLDIYQPPVKKNINDAKKITVSAKYHGRPDLLAYDLYGDGQLWWIFVIYNMDKLVDPLKDLKAGMELIVPKNFKAAGI